MEHRVKGFIFSTCACFSSSSSSSLSLSVLLSCNFCLPPIHKVTIAQQLFDRKGYLSFNMVYPETFRGFQIEDPKHWSDFKLNELTPKPFGDYDVDVKIQACGICASDLHTVSGGWGEQHFPLCVGHGISSLPAFDCN